MNTYFSFSLAVIITGLQLVLPQNGLAEALPSTASLKNSRADNSADTTSVMLSLHGLKSSAKGRPVLIAEGDNAASVTTPADVTP